MQRVSSLLNWILPTQSLDNPASPYMGSNSQNRDGDDLEEVEPFFSKLIQQRYETMTGENTTDGTTLPHDDSATASDVSSPAQLTPTSTSYTPSVASSSGDTVRATSPRSSPVPLSSSASLRTSSDSSRSSQCNSPNPASQCSAVTDHEHDNDHRHAGPGLIPPGVSLNSLPTSLTHALLQGWRLDRVVPLFLADPARAAVMRPFVEVVGLARSALRTAPPRERLKVLQDTGLLELWLHGQDSVGVDDGNVDYKGVAKRAVNIGRGEVDDLGTEELSAEELKEALFWLWFQLEKHVSFLEMRFPECAAIVKGWQSESGADLAVGDERKEKEEGNKRHTVRETGKYRSTVEEVDDEDNTLPRAMKTMATTLAKYLTPVPAPAPVPLRPPLRPYSLLELGVFEPQGFDPTNSVLPCAFRAISEPTGSPTGFLRVFANIHDWVEHLQLLRTTEPTREESLMWSLCLGPAALSGPATAAWWHGALTQRQRLDVLAGGIDALSRALIAAFALPATSALSLFNAYVLTAERYRRDGGFRPSLYRLRHWARCSSPLPFWRVVIRLYDCLAPELKCLVPKTPQWPIVEAKMGEMVSNVIDEKSGSTQFNFAMPVLQATSAASMVASTTPAVIADTDETGDRLAQIWLHDLETREFLIFKALNMT